MHNSESFKKLPYNHSAGIFAIFCSNFVVLDYTRIKFVQSKTSRVLEGASIGLKCFVGEYLVKSLLAKYAPDNKIIMHLNLFISDGNERPKFT